MTARFLIIFSLSCAAAALVAGCSSAATPVPTPANLSPLEYQGYDLFNLNCASCHSTSPDTKIVGPSLYGIARTAGTRVPGQDAETYLRTSILKPDDFFVEGYPEAMPPDFGKRLTGEEFDAIIAYLLTLQ